MVLPGFSRGARSSGLRRLHPLDDGSGVIAGMADAFNLVPGGGWELRVLKEGSPKSKAPQLDAPKRGHHR